MHAGLLKCFARARPGILKLVVAVLVVAFLSGLLVSFNAPAKTAFAQQTSPTGSDQALIELYKKVIPSVVSISVSPFFSIIHFSEMEVSS